jgi:hypothetical protein
MVESSLIARHMMTLRWCNVLPAQNDDCLQTALSLPDHSIKTTALCRLLVLDHPELGGGVTLLCLQV